MRTGLAAILAAFVCGCAAQTSRRDTPTITKIEARTLPPEVVTERVLHQLFNVFALEPYVGPAGRRPTTPLTDLRFQTRPFSTYQLGLCQRDIVQVYFHRAGPDSLGAHTPVRATRLEVSHEFHVLTLRPDRDLEEAFDDSAHALQQETCEALNPEQTHFFAAYGVDAINGARIFDAIVTQAARDVVPFELTCDDPRTPCRILLNNARNLPFVQVAQCEPPSSNTFCYNFNVSWQYEVTAIVPRTSPEVIERLKVDAMIVIADSRID
jgi:hypothetical protein